MAIDNFSFRKAFGPGCRYKVRPYRFQDGPSCLSCILRKTCKRTGNNRHNPALPAVNAIGRKPVELLRKKHDHQQGKPEAGNGDSDHGGNHETVVHSTVPMHCCRNSQRNPYQTVNQHA